MKAAAGPEPPAPPRRLVVGITGASGVVYGIRLLEFLSRDSSIESHLILTPAARATIVQETSWRPRDVERLAGVVHPNTNIGASIASGSFETAAMIVAPCSIKTLSAVANCYSNDLLSRAADVHLKEGRPLLLLVRETPLHLGHLRLMSRAAAQGAVIMPPVPAFYGAPQTVDDLVNATVGRALARAGFDNSLYRRWTGMAQRAPAAAKPRPPAGR
jgi:4-hydroxy-3-polyprenylbenzoate decarboxylase